MRAFGTFYRIGFYGSEFKELNGQEYVYKEKGYTRLPEVKSKMLERYRHVGNLSIVLDSNPIDMRSLDPSEVKIQINSVDPYYEGAELRTDFQTFYNTGLHCFAFMSYLTVCFREIRLQHTIYQRW